MTSNVAYIENNKEGRSFVVGDIHGAFELVVQALKQTNFDWEKDRLYVVGDLIDRGPESWRCAKFLKLPCVYGVRGNHEQMLLDLYAQGTPSEAVLQYFCQFNGLQWWLTTEESLRQDILEQISQLPLVLEVQTPRGSVGFIHAEVPQDMHWDEFKALIELGNPQAVQSCLWGRSRCEQNDHSGVDGVGRLFVGHTPHHMGLARRGNIYYMDTGAVFGLLQGKEQGHLTFANVLTQTASMVAPKATAGLVEIKDGVEPVIPFGQYAFKL